MTEKPEVTTALAYTTAKAAQVTGRSHTRIKLAIRRKELMARKDGRATLIEHAELQRWVTAMPMIGRVDPHVHPTPPPRRRKTVASDGSLARD